MRKFEVCIKGENFLVELDGKIEKKEFYAARFVEAMDSSTAVDRAMEILRRDLKDYVLNKPEDPPVMKIEEIDEVYFFQEKMALGNRLIPGKGFLWVERKKIP